MVDRYDADAPAPAPQWLATDANERREAIRRAHDGLVDALHRSTLQRSMHVSLHLVVENMLAEGEPHVTATLERITEQGVRRHAALHMVMEVLARRMAAMMAEQGPWSDQRWRASLDAIDPGDWIGARMAADLQPDRDDR